MPRTKYVNIPIVPSVKEKLDVIKAKKEKQKGYPVSYSQLLDELVTSDIKLEGYNENIEEVNA